MGNLVGAIRPAIALAVQNQTPAYFFIADFHALTSLKDPAALQANVRYTAAAWLASGLDPAQAVFYRQSRIPEVTELAWYLNCFTPYPMLANAHSFKDKADRLHDVNAGLFTYPVLMAADILLYDAELVPVGSDQKQHLEITRDIASAVNNMYGTEVFVVPEAYIKPEVMTVPGTDGRKMSKSYGNTINVFLPEKQLRKAVMKIVTDSTPLGDPLRPGDTVFQLFELLAEPAQTAELRRKYLAGGDFGYGHAKQLLFELILESFREERVRFDQLIADPAELDRQLEMGEARAREVATAVLDRTRKVLGYR